MAFNIDNFVNRGLILGGARPSLFDVELNLPQGLTGISGRVRDKFRFTCRATSIPASTIASIDVPYFGRQVKLAGDRTFADWNVTVMNDEDYIVRDAFEAWHNAINTIVDNKKIPEFTGNSYRSSATVRHYPKTGDGTIKLYSFVNMFPVNISEMGLDWETTNQIQTFDVTFAYDYWIPLPTNGTVIPTGASQSLNPPANEPPSP